MEKPTSVSEVGLNDLLCCQADYQIIKQVHHLLSLAHDKEKFRPLQRQAFDLRNTIFDKLLGMGATGDKW